MSAFLKVVIMFGIAVTLISAFFGLLPVSPLLETIQEMKTFLMSESVSQGLAWFAWFFPVGNIVSWFPAIVNAVIAFYGAKMTLLILKLNV